MLRYRLFLRLAHAIRGSQANRYFERYCNHPGVRGSQMHMLSQMAVVLATDLNLASLVCAPGQTAEKLELQRTYAAVYLISSTLDHILSLPCPLPANLRYYSISMAFRKPLTLSYNHSLLTCSRALADVGGSPVDIYMANTIQIQRISEDIARTFHYDIVNAQHPSIELLEMTIPIYEHQLQEIKRSCPPDNSCTGK